MSEPTVDVAYLYAALDRKRQSAKLSWRGLAQEIGITPSTFTRMSQGRRPDVDTFAGLLRWLGMPVEAFLQPVQPQECSEEEPLAMIGAYLRMDKNLSAEAAAALERLIRVAYETLAEDDGEQDDDPDVN